MDQGVLERWGVTPHQFDAVIKTIDTDEEILAWAERTVGAAKRDLANRWLLDTKTENLDRQDREEGVVRA